MGIRIRRLLISCLIAILILCDYATGEPLFDIHFTEARALADSLEQKYGIQILIGEECIGTEAQSTYAIGSDPIGGSPLQSMLGYRNYLKDVQTLAEALSKYPEGFTQVIPCPEAPGGLRFLIVDQVYDTERGGNYGALTVIGKGTYDINLAVQQIYESTIHHELWHAIELRITADVPDAFSDWNRLNPEGFSYSRDYYSGNYFDYRALLYEDPESFFTLGYSVVSEYEDRATIAEFAFEMSADWWQLRPHLVAKLQEISWKAAGLFGDLFNIGIIY